MLRKPTIYIIDSNEDILLVVSGLLGNSGFTVETFTSIEALLRLSKISDLGCILIDKRIESISGTNIQEELKRRDCHLPFIYMSGADINSNRLGSPLKQPGKLSFLHKPFSNTELLDQVNLAVGQSNQLQAENVG